MENQLSWKHAPPLLTRRGHWRALGLFKGPLPKGWVEPEAFLQACQPQPLTQKQTAHHFAKGQAQTHFSKVLHLFNLKMMFC